MVQSKYIYTYTYIYILLFLSLWKTSPNALSTHNHPQSGRSHQMSAQLGFQRSEYKDVYLGKMTKFSVLIISYDSRIPKNNGQCVPFPKRQTSLEGILEIEALLVQVPGRGCAWRELESEQRRAPGLRSLHPMHSAPLPLPQDPGNHPWAASMPTCPLASGWVQPRDVRAGAQSTGESEAWGPPVVTAGLS